MIIYSYPKINIGLYITEKRNDGFHNLETIFYPIENQFDTINISKIEKGVKLIVGGPVKIPSGEQNLCLRAVRLLQTYFPSIDGIEIDIFKMIPSGAGLGGGSSNAAAVLIGLNEIFNIGLTNDELKTLGVTLGSDVPFFIEQKPSVGKGRGEILEPITLSLKHKTVSIITPNFSVSTKNIFQFAYPQNRHIPLKEAIQAPIKEWKEIIFNDFEKILFPFFPELKKIKEDLYAQGADYVSLSGSGSSIFAIGDKPFSTF